MGRYKSNSICLLSRVCLFCLMILAFGSSQAAIAGNDVIIMELDGSINPGSAYYIVRGITEAEEAGAALIIIQLDTPGGLASSMRTMVKAIMNSMVPVVVYVAPTGSGAASAGVMVTVSAHIAAMAPGTNIGAAHLVTAGGEDIQKTMSEKVVNDMASYGRGIAKERKLAVGVVEHVMKVIRELSERVIVLEAGELIAEGPYETVSKNPRVIEAYLGGGTA